MARPRIYPADRVVAAVRLSRSTHQQLQKQAQVEKRPLNVVMTSAIESYLQRAQQTHHTKVQS